MRLKKLNGECQTRYVHSGRVQSARKALHDEATTLDLSETFKVLSDPTRLSIVLALTA